MINALIGTAAINNQIIEPELGGPKAFLIIKYYKTALFIWPKKNLIKKLL